MEDRELNLMESALMGMIAAAGELADVMSRRCEDERAAHEFLQLHKRLSDASLQADIAFGREGGLIHEGDQ